MGWPITISSIKTVCSTPFSPAGTKACLQSLTASRRRFTASKKQLACLIEYFLDAYEHEPDLVHIFITEFSRSSHNLNPERLTHFKSFIARTVYLIKNAQENNELRTDIKAHYLAYLFLGGLETFLSSMVLENQAIDGARMKRNIKDGLLDLFLSGARAR